MHAVQQQPLPTLDALANVGSDLTVLLGIAVGNELLAGSEEAGISQPELVVLLLFVNIVLSAAPSMLTSVRMQARLLKASVGKEQQATLELDGNSLLGFVGLVASVAKRITTQCLVQIVAQICVATQPTRTGRVLALLSTAVFFVFLSTTASFGRAGARIATTTS